MNRSQVVQRGGLKKIALGDMVKSSRKADQNDWGIQGYHVAKQSHMDKPTVFSIPKPTENKKDFLSMIINREKNIPGPT